MASAEPARANRLAKEKSPYLLQHAHNPVDWHPWGEEAFEKARREKKPIFLSIGYSTCHWCHVMERESFEDPATARLLNEHFVPIKVDREERPDVDALYMQAVMQMTGQGGWPLSVFLTPELHPFYGGTYFPPEDRWGQPGFKSLLRSLADGWANRREEVLRSGRAMVEHLRAEQSAGAAAGKEGLSQETIARAFQALSESYDETYGGFLPAPKFPRSHALSLLLRRWKRTGDPEPLKIAEKTLRAMAAGGMYDPIGGGFHRYSTDAQWHVPHFEKMLYDQALLARSYLEAYQATGEAEHAATAREIFDYVLRDMTGPEGGFYSAEDADSLPAVLVQGGLSSSGLTGGSDPRPRSSRGKAFREDDKKEKKEGAFYVWTAKEIEETLGKPEAELFDYCYGVQLHGNAAHDPMGEFAGKNILYRAHSVAEAARKLKQPEKEIEERLSAARRKLLEARGRRPRPHLDDKVLADWNGLMISALAFGAQILDEPRYAQAAKRAADFILENLTVHPESFDSVRSGQAASKGRLLHRYRDGEAAIPGHLEDYAFLIHGLADLYQAGFDPKYLAEAKRLSGEMVRLFWDEKEGGFFLTGTDAEKLLVRQKDLYDGAIPSGNSVAALDLIRVGRLSGDGELEGKASRLMQAFGAQVSRQPSAFPQLLIALDFALGPSREIVIAGVPGDPAAKEMLRMIRGAFSPNQVVTFHPPGGADFPMLEGKPTAYVCQNYACRLPTNRLEKLKELLVE